MSDSEKSEIFKHPTFRVFPNGKYEKADLKSRKFSNSQSRSSHAFCSACCDSQLQARVSLRPTGLTIEGQLVAVPENVTNINAMYLKARPILLACLTCSLPGVRYRCLTECNSRVDN